MKTKNEKNLKFYFILKQKLNVSLDPRIIMTHQYQAFLIVKT